MDQGVWGAAPAAGYRRYRPGELRADRWMHVLGVGAGCAGAIGLLTTTALRGDPWVVLGVGVYALGLLAMLSFSASYNLARPSPFKENLRRFDHAAIFTMIAGTYTPFFLNRVGGAWAAGMLGFVWAVALAGVLMAIAAPRRHEKLQIVVYLLLGWSVIVARQPLGEHLSEPAGHLLLAGGLVYSSWVPVPLWRHLRYNTAIWHGLVLVAASCHYAAVLVGVVLPA